MSIFKELFKSCRDKENRKITAAIYLGWGIEKARNDNLDDALTNLTKAIELNPGLTEAYFQRGIVKAVQGFHKEAIKDYNKAIKIRPTYAQAYSFRAQSKEDLGDMDGAYNDRKRYYDLNKNDP